MNTTQQLKQELQYPMSKLNDYNQPDNIKRSIIHLDVIVKKIEQLEEFSLIKNKEYQNRSSIQKQQFDMWFVSSKYKEHLNSNSSEDSQFLDICRIYINALHYSYEQFERSVNE